MKLQEELGQIDRYIGVDTEKFNEQYQYLTAAYPNDKTQIDDYIESKLAAISGEISEAVDEISIKVQLMKVSEIVSMSYIAKNYFHRTRQWLYKKINGKPARFTKEEISTLNFALQDISKEIGSIAIHL
jgi:hypothetical protein